MDQHMSCTDFGACLNLSAPYAKPATCPHIATQRVLHPPPPSSRHPPSDVCNARRAFKPPPPHRSRYIWHTKFTETREVKEQVQRFFGVPYFLKHSALASWWARESFEFWFSLPGGGAMAHSDLYCETTVSMQLRGSKR